MNKDCEFIDKGIIRIILEILYYGMQFDSSITLRHGASQSRNKLAIKLKSIDWLILGWVRAGDGKV